MEQVNVNNQSPLILLVDDEQKFLDTVIEKIQLKGFNALQALSGEEALKIAKTAKIDMAIVDQRMAEMDGLTTIAKLKELHPKIITVLLTGFGDGKVGGAAGALDSVYFEKDEMRSFWNFIERFGSKTGMIIIPPPQSEKNADELARAFVRPEEIEMYAARQTLERNPPLTGSYKSNALYDSRVHKLIGETPFMLELKKNIQKVAALDCTVLIEGETGTGKELVARAIHTLSPRKNNKFMAVNCGSFSEDLLSNELFGHEKKAFSGAVVLKRGVFETASGGTIFLDEIGDTPPSMQVKLLRVLQEKTFLRVGGADEIPVEVRVLAATDQSLKKKIEKGEFYEDLYYRLNAFIIKVPPLVGRRNDIPLLSSYFLDKYRKEFGKEVKAISDEVLAIFMGYAFPGNVRELENAIERAVIMCEGDALRKEHLPKRFREINPPGELKKGDYISLAELEEQYILKIIQATKGNKSEAARILGINRASLWRKLKEMDAKRQKNV